MTEGGTGAAQGPPHHLQPGTMVGAYRVEALLDRGGMAYVYEATDVRLDRRVALKVLAWHDPDSSDFRERFLRESRFAASLDHPNIVPIYEAGEADGLLYIAMRFVRGTNLSRLIRREGPLDPKRTLAILSPVAGPDGVTCGPVAGPGPPAAVSATAGLAPTVVGRSSPVEGAADSAADSSVVNVRPVANRSAGSLAMAFMITGSAEASSLRDSASGVGLWLRWAHISAAWSSRTNGGAPARHS